MHDLEGAGGVVGAGERVEKDAAKERRESGGGRGALVGTVASLADGFRAVKKRNPLDRLQSDDPERDPEATSGVALP